MDGGHDVEDRVPARLSAAELRKFGLTVGPAFALLAAIAWWRGHPTTTNVLGTVAALLLATGALVPTVLGPVYRAWMGLASLLSRITTPVFLGVVYFVIFTPVGVLRRAIGKNALDHARVRDSYWQPRASRTGGSMDRLF